MNHLTQTHNQSSNIHLENPSNVSNEAIQPDSYTEGIPQSMYQLIIDFSRKVSNKCEVEENPFGAIYYEKTQLLELLFPDKDWASILNSTNKIDSKNGSIYDLGYIYRNHFQQSELDKINRTVTTPDRLYQDSITVAIDQVYSVSYDKFYNYIQAGDKLFKVNKTQNVDKEGALKLVFIPTGHYVIDYYPLNKEAEVKDWLPMFKEIIKPVQYVLDFLRKDEFDNYKRKLQFLESKQGLSPNRRQEG